MAKPKQQSSRSVRVVITSPGGNLAQRVSELKQRGLKVDSVLNEIGIITGQIPSEKLDEFRNTPGITVEPDERVQLPPPDAPVQ